jgi:hypothetical protein
MPRTQRSVFTLLALLLAFVALPAQSKPNLVLLPIETSDDVRQYETEFGSALQQGLQERYTVFFGPAVERELEKEYSKLDCTAESCNQNVAIAFNGELVADASVKSVGDGFLLKMVIQNVFTNRVVITDTRPCRDCDVFSVIDILQQMGAGSLPQSPTPLVAVQPERAIIFFDTDPTHADVSVNGQPAGITPYQGLNHNIGEQVDIEVRSKGYQTLRLNQVIIAPITQLGVLTLAADAPNEGFAAIEINSEPMGADVYIDDLLVGTTPYQSVNFTQGQTLNIRVSLADHQTHYKTVYLNQPLIELPLFSMVPIVHEITGADRYQKLDAEGGALPDDALQWECIRDAQTNLVWEVKNTSSANKSDKTYRYKDAVKFAESTNKRTLFRQGGHCGLANWRLPSLEELRTLRVPENVPTIDTEFFPYTKRTEYWSSTEIENGFHATVQFIGNVGVIPPGRPDTDNWAVRRVAKPPLLTVDANTQGKESYLYVDGQIVAQGIPPLSAVVGDGKHRVYLATTEGETVRQDIAMVNSDKAILLTYPLKLFDGNTEALDRVDAALTGAIADRQLIVRTSQSVEDAYLFIDGQLITRGTPPFILEWPEGDYTLAIRNKTGGTAAKDVTISRRDLDVSLDFYATAIETGTNWPNNPTQKRTIMVTTSPPIVDGRFYVNGEIHASGATPIMLHLIPGSYGVSVATAQLRSEDQKVVIRESDYELFEVNLNLLAY